MQDRPSKLDSCSVAQLTLGFYETQKFITFPKKIPENGSLSTLGGDFRLRRECALCKYGKYPT